MLRLIFLFSIVTPIQHIVKLFITIPLHDYDDIYCFDTHDLKKYLVGINVRISVNYMPDSDAMLGPNEYRAGSGPVTLTCHVEGVPTQENISYRWTTEDHNWQWDAQVPQIIYRPFLRINHAGIQTCHPTVDNATYDAVIEIKIVGRYILSGFRFISNCKHSSLQLLMCMIV